MFAQLGDHIFQGLKSPSSHSASYSMRYGVTERINRKDAIQPTGEGLDELSLTIQYAVEFSDPVAEIEALRRSMHECEVLPYIKGDGTIVGSFVITAIEETIVKTSPEGTIEAATVNISLLENADATVPTPVGTALTSQTPTEEPPEAPVPSPSNEIATDISQAAGNVSRMRRALEETQKGTTTVRQTVRKVRQLADDTQRLYSTAKTKVVATQKIIQRASQLPNSLDEAIRYAENLAQLDYTVDLSTLENGVEQMRTSAGKVTGSAAPIAAFSATREGGS